MPTHSFQDLRVWQSAMSLAELVYQIVRKLPVEERFALADQLRRCAISVPSNIAEDQKRLNRAELIQFCGIALGSNAELETQLLLVQRLYGLEVESAIRASQSVNNMLTGLIKSLRTQNQEPRTTAVRRS